MNIPFESYSIWLNLLIFAAAAGFIWYGGTRLERYAAAISLKTGVGQAFIGLILLAAATSLPEVATTVTATLNGNTTLAVSNLLGGVIVQTAVRRGNFSMAVSNIFGSNAFDVSLILLVSLLSGGQLIFQDVTVFTMFAAALGIVMTGIYLWGMLEWEDRTVLRMGWDSAAVVILYLIGSFAFYQLS